MTCAIFIWNGRACISGKEISEVIKQVKSRSYDTSPFEKSTLIPPFFGYKEEYQVAPKYHLSSCIIEKVMSTITEAIFCYITNTTEFTANHRSISTEVYYSVVRDPIDRFLSGFVDKCIKYKLFSYLLHMEKK
ncbi:hypothetical protein Aduo_014926 [Ancylostoma duodenale]